MAPYYEMLYSLTFILPPSLLLFYKGMSHGEEWRFLHVDPSVVILYYCGRGNTWNYEGGLVLSRERNSPPEHAAMAREVRSKLAILIAFPAC